MGKGGQDTIAAGNSRWRVDHRRQGNCLRCIGRRPASAAARNVFASNWTIAKRQRWTISYVSRRIAPFFLPRTHLRPLSQTRYGRRRLPSCSDRKPACEHMATKQRCCRRSAKFIWMPDTPNEPPSSKNGSCWPAISDVGGFATVGIIALVDEATGYQEVRDRLRYRRFSTSICGRNSPHGRERSRTDFYRQIFRLRGWDWRGMKINRPQCVAQYTKNLVYARLAPGILKELESRNPKTVAGRRIAKHYEWLTEDIGHPAARPASPCCRRAHACR